MNLTFNDNKLPYCLHMAVNSFSVIVCLLAVILVFVLNLHTKVVYRLALNQVLSAMALSVISLFQVTYFIINSEKRAAAHDPGCVAIGWFIFYSRWTKLLFTMWVTFHLFCFAVLQKNPRKLEVLHVVTSLLVPALIACIPLTTHAYASSGWCYLETNTIDRIVVWDAPAMVILLAASAAMIAMAIKLVHRRTMMYEPMKEGDQYWKAFKQLLPLVAFPILFLIFMLPQLVYDIHNLNAPYSVVFFTVVTVLIPLWNTSSGVTLLIHISVIRYRKKGNNATSDDLHENSLEQETLPIHRPMQ